MNSEIWSLWLHKIKVTEEEKEAEAVQSAGLKVTLCRNSAQCDAAPSRSLFGAVRCWSTTADQNQQQKKRVSTWTNNQLAHKKSRGDRSCAGLTGFRRVGEKFATFLTFRQSSVVTRRCFKS